jgi:hypothetical protein
MSPIDEKIISKVTEFYLTSRDFNGITLADLFKFSELDEKQFKELVEKLIRQQFIELIYEGDIPNPHIRPFPAPTVDKQLEKLSGIEINQALISQADEAQIFGEGELKISLVVDTIGCCVYPTPKHLKKVVDWKKYATRPFTLRLAKGEWQLRPYFFELGILAIYRNDPRYRYHTDDITGSLSAISEDLLNSSDQVFIQHFGFGFDDKRNRSVAVLLTDLSRLTPEHQQIWKAKMLGDYYKFKLHPDFRRSILGHCYEGNSVFSAFIEELKVINEMALKIRGVTFFKKTFEYNEKPENFGFLLLPTQREFEQFAQTLDRMLADNINDSFFEGLIKQSDLKTDEKLIEIKSIRKLEIWLEKSIRFPDPKPKDEMLQTFRAVRRLRSKPSHTYTENEWANSFFDEQKDLIKKSYRALRTLRLILTNNPRCRDVKVPDWLQHGEIRSF